MKADFTLWPIPRASARGKTASQLFQFVPKPFTALGKAFPKPTPAYLVILANQILLSIKKPKHPPAGHCS